MILQTIQPVVGSDRDFDYSGSNHYIGDMVTISYFLLRSVLEVTSGMPAALRQIAGQSAANSVNGFESCNTLRDQADTTQVPECVALYALGKFFFLHFLNLDYDEINIIIALYYTDTDWSSGTSEPYPEQ
jgi:hypothetical protein